VQQRLGREAVRKRGRIAPLAPTRELPVADFTKKRYAGGPGHVCTSQRGSEKGYGSKGRNGGGGGNRGVGGVVYGVSNSGEGRGS